MSHIIALSVDLAGQFSLSSNFPIRFARPVSRRTRVISTGVALIAISFGLSMLVALIQDL